MPSVLDSDGDLVRVALPVPLRGLFDYRWPSALGVAAAGERVSVPFGRRTLTGLIVALRVPATAGIEYKAVLRRLDEGRLAPEEWLASLQWAAGYYQHPLGEVIAAALPASLREGGPAKVARTTMLHLSDAGRAVLHDSKRRAQRLREGLAWLAEQPRPRVAGRAPAPFDAASLRRALAERWVLESGLPAAARPAVEGPALSPAQQAALMALQGEEGFSVSLLNGVTGSGKTELYLRLAERALAAGRQVLVLCPEIGLTPQLTARFRERFGAVVAGFHSGMGEAARGQAWLAVRDGDARVLVGTRSAVFAPFANLGLVIVDEEHDASYKQQDGFRYHARDLALVRAKAHGAAVVLGSATPALETLENARAGRYRQVRLAERIGGGSPPVPQCIDVKTWPAREGLSEPLAEAIGRHLDGGGQALLFINRRGYAPTLLCETCRWLAPCPHCDARLTYHRGERVLRCHHCGYATRPPTACPSCGGTTLAGVGDGSERVEEALKNRFPGKRVERFDTDRLRAAGRLEALLDDVRERRVDVLVGTQMLAKGHDFPHLSLVGVVNADQALFSADFRALERFGQLLTQVSGRAGRDAQSPMAPEVWIQTREPQHPALLTLLREGYPALAARLLRERREAGLPPFAHLALLRAEDADRGKVADFLREAQQAFPAREGLQLLGPAPAPMERRDGRHRAQLLLSAAARPALQRALGQWLPRLDALPAARRLRWSIDVDPVDLF